MGQIRTLHGDIDSRELGVTYSHDHIYCIPPYWQERQDDDLLLDDVQASERELADFAQGAGAVHFMMPPARIMVAEYSRWRPWPHGSRYR